MSIPSPEKLAHIAISIAGEIWDYGCVGCTKENVGVEMHEIIKREMRPMLGGVVCVLGITLAPLCPHCHLLWSQKTADAQMHLLQLRFAANEKYRWAQRRQIEALRARWMK